MQTVSIYLKKLFHTFNWKYCEFFHDIICFSRREKISSLEIRMWISKFWNCGFLTVFQIFNSVARWKFGMKKQWNILFDSYIQSQTEHVNTRSTHYELFTEYYCLKTTHTHAIAQPYLFFAHPHTGIRALVVEDAGCEHIRAERREEKKKRIANKMAAAAWCLFLPYVFGSLFFLWFFVRHHHRNKMEFLYPKRIVKASLARIHDELYLRINKWERMFAVYRH